MADAKAALVACERKVRPAELSETQKRYPTHSSGTQEPRFRIG